MTATTSVLINTPKVFTTVLLVNLDQIFLSFACSVWGGKSRDWEEEIPIDTT